MSLRKDLFVTANATHFMRDLCLMALSHLAGSTLRTTNECYSSKCVLCSFYVLLLSAKAFVLGDVVANTPVRRKFSAGLVIFPPDKIFEYTAMYVGPIWPSVTGP